MSLLNDYFDFLERRHQKHIEEADSAWDRCSDWWKEHVYLNTRNGVPPWVEGDPVPGGKDSLLDQYRYWLYENGMAHSEEAMEEFFNFMAETEYEEWLEWGRDDFPWC